MNSSVFFIWYFYCWLLLKLYIFIKQVSLLTILEERRLNGKTLTVSFNCNEIPQSGRFCLYQSYKSYVLNKHWSFLCSYRTLTYSEKWNSVYSCISEVKKLSLNFKYNWNALLKQSHSWWRDEGWEVNDEVKDHGIRFC